MCFAHVIRNVRKRPFASKNNKKLIIDDIRKIQLAQNRKMFDEMSRLFLLKWKGVEPNFVDYFKREWLGTHSNWFEGAADYTPSTNNALESHNAVIKRKVTFRRRLPLHEFLEAMHRMASNISKQFTDGSRDIATEPDISRDTMMRAAQMANEGFKTFKGRGKESGLQFYVFPGQKCPEDNATYKYYKDLVKKDWKTFDEYITYGYQIFWVVHFSEDQWKTESICTCPFFFKQHMCKHIIAIALREKIIDCPETANPMLIAPRRAPGRSKNATNSLMRD